MKAHTVISILLTFLCSLSAALETEHTVDILAWPLSAPKRAILAKITYNSTAATVKSYTQPTISSSDDIVRIGYYHPSGSWSGIATAASNFAPEKSKKLLLHLNSDGKLYHVGFRASDYGTSSAASNTKDGLSVELVKVRPGPTPHLNKPVVVNADGSVPSKEPEKSFLQKYWYFIAGFLVLQVVMSSGKGE
ncbi:hypothetical protein LTR91_017412 [Friedmanniomyces endolithicus]|uniref:ER membrane protein complex subunit 10 n=1 Tax=Friedmanniomyces endolithicus TaxID=329885 RepID=A0A4U0VM88_9PEZI|nr:hypothetical protein LTS09_006864 [Friedmanniomyces endolithicus]KAK0288779.1 hypothetical protein LTR35_003178 [Friedmanniomyces endolithicus]KAK0300547.1 hypothetical protein LTS00_000803 [Friedmanniomyces endolithicus]KAK0316417.1 hypothetical protein LTR01_000165 [Friedmanniomyces endolithicus]KAK0328409.1 hypothetical protein LTR82_000339 [Friedmanniomyces endolithicus]